MDLTSRRFWKDHEADLPPLIPVRTLRERLEREPLGRLRVGDTSDPERLGFLGAAAGRFVDVLCWDNHPPHPTDLRRAPMPPSGACTSALVLELDRRGIRPTPAQASLFLLGVHVDTGHFTYPGTSGVDHQAAALCLGWGAPADLPRKYVPKGYTSHQIDLLERISRGVSLVPVGRQDIPLAVLETLEFEPDLSVIFEQLREAEGWPAAFLLVGQGGRVSIIGRSDGSLDTGAVLRALGGGGHPEAASATLRGTTLLDARMVLEGAILDRLERRKSAGDLAVKTVVHLPATASVAELADLLHRYRINAVPLSEGEGEDLRFVGLVSRQEADAALRHRLGERPAIEISAGPPAWVAPETPVAEARRKLIADGRRLLAVGTPPGPPLGILSRGTLFRDWEAEDHSRPDTEAGLDPVRVGQILRVGLGAAWPGLERLGALAQELGQTLWLVGGPVRDLLLGKAARDIDVVVEGDAMALARAAALRLGGRARVHEAFGTARWDHDDLSVDLATARVEWYEAPAALPRVMHAELRRDLYRRDFTINAMAIALHTLDRAELVDPFGGARDLRQRLLRVLHGLSFHDDPTRAFRAARFAARFDFRLAPQTEGLLRSALRSGVLRALGPERLGAELDRILGELEVVQAFRLLRDWELLPLIHPRFASGPALLDQLAAVCAARERMRGAHGHDLDLRPSEPLWLVLAACVPEAERASLVRLVPGDRRAQRRWLLGPERAARALAELWTARTGSEAARALEGLDLVERTYALGVVPGPRNERWLIWWEREGRLIRSAVSAADLLARGAQPGPALGTALRVAQEAAWDGAAPEAQLAAAEHLALPPPAQDGAAPSTIRPARDPGDGSR